MKKLFCLLLWLVTATYGASALALTGWIITNYTNPAKIMSGNSYHLKVINSNNHLVYKTRDYGINLGWNDGSTPANIKFYKKPVAGNTRNVNSGDKIAIYVKGGGYLKYESRRWGINLVWSKTPVYEWQLRNQQNKRGTPVLTDAKIAIYNAVEQDFMQYCKRTGVPVVNLGWARDCPDGSRLPGSINYIRDYIPYLEKAIIFAAPLLL